MKGRPLLVAIVGGSGSGKTWLAERLKAKLGGKAAHLSLDNFYRDRSHLPPSRRARVNFDNPASIDWKTLRRVLSAVLRRRRTDLPAYDFKTHCRVPQKQVFTPKPIVLIEGLWLLRASWLRRLFGFAVFLDCPAGTRLMRRLDRDLQYRGRSQVDTRVQFWTTVEPMHKKFVQPQSQRADVIVRGRCGRHEVAALVAALQALSAVNHFRVESRACSTKSSIPLRLQPEWPLTRKLPSMCYGESTVWRSGISMI